MEEPKTSLPDTPAAKEKIREFCYELALALRRITGKTVENDLAFLDYANTPPEGLLNPDVTNVTDVTKVTENLDRQDA
ncbi:hypothetical protein [Anaerolinea sp.]|uniref:hypothetical protein n=1 Tax=Anaerolinea sp. TaxID=1872519 RepID=UPI002ACD25B3|nr:hypothetical protein [Anaerolinea sp.]